MRLRVHRRGVHRVEVLGKDAGTFTFDQIERGEVIPASDSPFVPMDFAPTWFEPYVA